jgi:hypothetical protein
MKAKAAVKGTVLKSAAKYTWDVKWDDGTTRVPYKSQQLKELPKDGVVVTPLLLPPASITITTQGTYFLRLVVDYLISSSHTIVFCLKVKGSLQPPPSWQRLLRTTTMLTLILVPSIKIKMMKCLQ